MRKLPAILTAAAAPSLTTGLPVFADTATYTKTIRGHTVRCTVTYTDVDGSRTLTAGDIVTAVICTSSS